VTQIVVLSLYLYQLPNYCCRIDLQSILPVSECLLMSSSDNHFVIDAKTPETEGKLIIELEGTSGSFSSILWLTLRYDEGRSSEIKISNLKAQSIKTNISLSIKFEVYSLLRRSYQLVIDLFTCFWIGNFLFSKRFSMQSLGSRIHI
jgi:hypothetical protein